MKDGAALEGLQELEFEDHWIYFLGGLKKLELIVVELGRGMG